MLFVLTAYLSTSCQKDQIAPANQEVAFVKYYGHVGAQTATDVIQTSDGGYILLGSTNSYSSRNEKDIFVVKTDSLGNELWSTAFGKLSGRITGNSNFDYVRYDEEGIRIIELPDQSAYVVAANRTYIDYPNENAIDGVRGQTKIVLYELDYASGMPIIQDGVELRSATISEHTEEVSDMKIDTAGGAYQFVLTGYTTDVLPNKPNDDDNGLFDGTDIFTVLLNRQFGIEWLTSSLASGFPGDDYGTSIQILDIGYLVCGTSEEKQVTSQSSTYVPRIAVVVMEKSGGTPISPDYFGDEGYYFDKAYSVYDASTNTVTIASHVLRGSGANANQGNIAVLQVQPTISAIIPVTPSAPGPTYCLYYDLENRKEGIGTENFAASLASVPGNNGYILSSTQTAGLGSDICITKFDQDLNIETGWPYHFGYSDEGTLIISKDEAGTIIPVMSGSSNQSTVVGYVFAGKFGLGTNEMMGMVRLNLNGTLTP